MKLFITVVFLFFASNLLDAQQLGQPNVKTQGKSKLMIQELKVSALQQLNIKKSNLSFQPKKAGGMTLNLTALIQGYFNGSAMNSVYPIQISVELHDAVTMIGIESQFGTLNTSGQGVFNFSTVVNGTPYYIVVKSKNTIETWSASPASFNSGTMSYDFTSSSAQAYGNNLILKNGRYCFYSGDVNQDGVVDIYDLSPADNDVKNFNTGFLATDINGDGTVDIYDLSILDNNSSEFASVILPSNAPIESFVYYGQTYHSILIGTQYWLKENLNIGSEINGSQSQSNNGIIEKYCYNDLPGNCITYGGLYQWNEALQYAPGGTKVQGLCPSNWHIPSFDDLSTLSASVIGNSNALKSIGQGVDTAAGTNSSGFSALLAGLRLSSTGTYSDLGIGGDGYFWSSTPSGVTNATLMDLSGYDKNIYQYSVNQGFGFSVRCVKDGWLLIQSPTGGESFKSGSIQNISWKSSNITNAKLEFTTDNGTTWATIIGSVPASDHSYSWTIPNTPSTQCLVKLSDASDSTIKSISPGQFTIWTPTLSLSAPNGGENWKVGEIDSIKWTSSNVANVSLEYSTNNGTNWNLIIASTPASNASYAWTIPFTPSTNCRVRIIDIGDTNFKAISSNVFTISNPPCPGAETVSYGGQTYNTVKIGNQCWLKENLNIGTRINGISEQTNNGIIEKYCYANNPANCTTYGGLYEWAETVQYQNGATNTNSTNPPLYGHIQGICPAGWHIPDTTEFSILANSVNYDGNSLKSVGQGSGSGRGTNTSGFSALLAGVRYSDGTYSLLGIYNFFGTSTEVNPTDIYYVDMGTDSNFIFVGTNLKSYGRSIRCIKDGSVSLQSPNGGESIQAGTTHNITWSSSYLTNARIELTTDNGASWSTVIASVPASAGSYNWTVPNTPSTLCKIRITDAVDSTVKSISANVFTILPQPAITITSPNGGENWKVGEVDTVKWTSTNVTNAKIEYTTDNGTTWTILTASTPAADGSYLWTIPDMPSVNCKVRVGDASDALIKSESAAIFTIAN